MFKLQIAIGINNPTWLDMRRLDKFVDGVWITPTYATRDGAWAAVIGAGDTFLDDCRASNLLRVVEADAPVAPLKITVQSLALFLAYAKDAGNWSGQPLVGGNVGGSKEDRGNLTQLKRAKLITTSEDEGNTWLRFTEAGKALALSHGITI
jgi:hypothetical protein